MSRFWIAVMGGILLHGSTAGRAHGQTYGEFPSSWDSPQPTLGFLQSEMEALLDLTLLQSGGAAAAEAVDSIYSSCGDNYCAPHETYASCPNDCPLPIDGVVDGVIDGLTNLTIPLGPLPLPTRACTCIATFVTGATFILESTVVDRGDDSCARLELELPLERPELSFATSFVCAETPSLFLQYNLDMASYRRAQ